MGSAALLDAASIHRTATPTFAMHPPFPVRLCTLAGLALLLAGCHGTIHGPGRYLPQSAPPVLTGPANSLYAAGDIADCRRAPPHATGASQTAELVARELANDAQAIVLTLGDHTYPVGLPAEFNDCYHPTWGRFKARTYPAPGNHEYYTPGAPGYYDYFGAQAGPNRRGYYSFKLGNWHIVSLNSYLAPAEHAQQMNWLKDDLARHPAPCRLAYWHHPVFSSGGHGNLSNMRDAWKILMDAGADVVLAAHDHDYERFAPTNAHGEFDPERGMRQFVIGTGGAKLTPLLLPKPTSEVAYNGSHGVLKMTLRDNGYTWEFLPVTGEFSDRGAAACR